MVWYIRVLYVNFNSCALFNHLSLWLFLSLIHHFKQKILSSKLKPFTVDKEFVSCYIVAVYFQKYVSTNIEKIEIWSYILV